MRRLIIVILALFLMTGCEKKTDYSYDYTGVSDAPLIHDTSTAEEARKERVIRHMGFSIRFPEDWENESETSSGILYVRNGSDKSNYISVDLLTYEGIETMDTPDVLRGIAIYFEGAERTKAGTISVAKNFPCWKSEFKKKKDGKDYNCVMEIYLTDAQHAVVYTSSFEDSIYKSDYDTIQGIRNSLNVMESPTKSIPAYTVREGVGDLWSGIEGFSLGDINFKVKDKLSAVLSEDLKMYDDNEMLAPGDTKWVRLYQGENSFLVLLRNDSDMRRSATDCKIYGVDAAFLFTGDGFKWDDFDCNTTFETVCTTFGLPAYQDGSLAIWELDGQDLYVSFEESGEWARVAVVTLSDEEKTAREDAYVEALEAAQSEDWMNSVVQ